MRPRQHDVRPPLPTLGVMVAGVVVLADALHRPRLLSKEDGGGALDYGPHETSPVCAASCPVRSEHFTSVAPPICPGTPIVVKAPQGAGGGGGGSGGEPAAGSPWSSGASVIVPR